MEKRVLAEAVEQPRYFEAVPDSSLEERDGTRDMGPLYPFLISGGTNTEHYYFLHINDITDYKFNIFPKYFGNESGYTKLFPERIKDIIKNNAGAKVFCVFDLDTVFSNETNQEKHKTFEKKLRQEIANGSVVLCPSMPSIEYWFLLHFENRTQLIKTCGRTMQKLLAPYMMPFFQNTNGKKLLSVLKSEEFVKDSGWVVKLCENGKLDDAIQRAENNIKAAETARDLDSQSYSYVYLLFKN